MGVRVYMRSFPYVAGNIFTINLLECLCEKISILYHRASRNSFAMFVMGLVSFTHSSLSILSSVSYIVYRRLVEAILVHFPIPPVHRPVYGVKPFGIRR